MNIITNYTPGPWRWEINLRSKCLQLVGGKPRFDLTVMDFVRWGMSGASIRLREDVEHMNIMHRVERWAKPVPGREHHAEWFQDIDHPDARLLAAAPGMAARIEHLEAINAELVAALGNVMQYCVTPKGVPDKDKGRTAEQQFALDKARAAIASAKAAR